MKRNRGHDYSGLIIWAALLVAAVRYAGAFVASDTGRVDGLLSDVLSAGMVVSGLGMGVLDVIGSAYVLDGWRRALPRSGQRWPVRFQVLTGFLVTLVVSGVVILVPFTVSRVLGVGMAEVVTGMWLWVWALLVNAAPYLVLGGVVFAQSGVVVVTQSPADARGEESGAGAGALKSAPYGKGGSTRGRKKAHAAAYACAQCGRTFEHQQGLAAHMRFCKGKDGEDGAHSAVS